MDDNIYNKIDDGMMRIKRTAKTFTGMVSSLDEAVEAADRFAKDHPEVISAAKEVADKSIYYIDRHGWKLFAAIAIPTLALGGCAGYIVYNSPLFK
jgi:hypothetical protein